ncbi:MULTISPECIES: EAL domain-containing protein [unclassified Mesorhizobium]|uniref:EAL domain-containing protein n=1 Tax=unclassified Mesorhizobium TaxID=325217 RepID=UPI000FCA19CD|nr:MULTISPECIES: EAL domain-containing protein [unclassified Mesorhizobium]RVD54632.1 EAL domain-containing protein [Mesorhizobium sp. M2D.F.Ca.ET.140.01.1.1]TGP69465.1 EAL domain-containing protein [Mesorhizobium sp. M2D.F.Ca.ET.224.01.1.1]TGP86853.1 EAL domain-containing protein [bacterium M00.F.Ca.ET.222.01.1.1]
MRGLKDISVGTKLSLGFGLALLCVVAVGVFGVAQLRSLNKVTSEITSVWLPQVQIVGEMKRNLAEHQLYATLRVRTAEAAQIAGIEKEMARESDEILQGRRAYRRSAGSLAEQQLFDQFVNLWTAYEDSLTSIFPLLETGGRTMAVKEFETVSLPTVAAATQRLDDLLALTNERSTAAAVMADRTYTVAQRLTWLAVLFAAGCLGGLVAWIRHNVSKPILAVTEAMRCLAQGERRSSLIALKRDRQDEVGVLFSAFAGYRASLERSDALAREAELERQQLAAAAANMPVGLCMFDAERRLVLCNQSYADLYHVPEPLTRPGTPWIDLMRFRIAAGLYAGHDPEKYVQQLTETIDRAERTVSLVELRDGRTIDLIHQPLPGGGWLATHHDVTDLRRSEAKISYMARHDGLTELPNRILFRERAEEALVEMRRDGSKIAFHCLDLDHFKMVNDTLGHPVGDALLKEVAARLKQVAREGDTVARLGGDEFVIIQTAVDQPVEATALAQRVIDGLSAPYVVDGHGVMISASIGISIAPDDGIDADQLLKTGDMALYRAKAEGRGTYRFFEPEMDARMQARRFLELDLCEAVVRQQFEIYYQPLLNLDRGEVSCFEALLRWHHPTRGIVSPGEFIPLAEDIGLIVPIGEWVIKQACLDAASWPGSIKVAVNLCPAQFRNARLLSTIVEALDISGLPPSRLELEITETVLLANSQATLSMLQHIHMLGVHIAMDDFGTGYSSLSYLRSFPFDKIKIDQSFITDAGDIDSSVAIIRAVTSLGNSLGMQTTAEGVETVEQLERVRREGCTEAQGFLLSRPLPARDIPAMLERTRAVVAGEIIETEPETSGERDTDKPGRRRSRASVPA